MSQSMRGTQGSQKGIYYKHDGDLSGSPPRDKGHQNKVWLVPGLLQVAL
jgi:hypothetical protein